MSLPWWLLHTEVIYLTAASHKVTSLIDTDTLLLSQTANGEWRQEQPIERFMTEGGWLGLRVGGQLALVFIH